jgi:hypothetical protein
VRAGLRDALDLQARCGWYNTWPIFNSIIITYYVMGLSQRVVWPESRITSPEPKPAGMWARERCRFSVFGVEIVIDIKSTCRGPIQRDNHSNWMIGRDETGIATALDVLVYSELNLVDRRFKSKQTLRLYLSKRRTYRCVLNNMSDSQIQKWGYCVYASSTSLEVRRQILRNYYWSKINTLAGDPAVRIQCELVTLTGLFN